MDPMISSIAMVGAGALGLYYGARLARAGRDVRFLARGELATLQAQGILIKEPAQSFRVPSVRAHGSVDEIGPVDLAIVTLKTTANAALPALLPPLLHERTAVLTLQNGLGSEEQVAAVVGAERVLGGLCFVASMRTAPGEVTCLHPGSITMGEFGRPASARTREIAALLNEAGIVCNVTDSLDEARWRKLVWNVPFNGLSIAAGGITTDRICADPALAAEARALMLEVAAAARAFGYEIPGEFQREQFEVTPPMGAYAPSSLVDYLAKREVEVEPIWGEPLRRARKARVDTPRLALLHALLARLAAR
jgi:2-dehydropantoate 2-reductase